MRTPNDIKKALHALADQLPENATWKDVAARKSKRAWRKPGAANLPVTTK